MDISFLVLWQFFHLLKEIIPYFFLGAFFAATIATFVKPQWGYKFLNDNIFPVFIVSFIAAVLPGCACATMPMAEGLKRKGIKTGTLTAFIAMSPLLAPHTVFLTYGMLGWEFALARVAASFIFIPILGIALNFLSNNPSGKCSSEKYNNNQCCKNNLCHTYASTTNNKPRWTVFFKHFKEISLNLGKYFLIGLAIAAAFSVFMPEDTITLYLGSSNIFSYALAVVIGIPMYVCEGEEVPIAFGLLNKGLGAGPTFTFLLASVGTCIPTILMAKKMLGGKITLIYVIFWFVFVILSGFIFGEII